MYSIVNAKTAISRNTIHFQSNLIFLCFSAFGRKYNPNKTTIKATGTFNKIQCQPIDTKNLDIIGPKCKPELLQH